MHYSKAQGTIEYLVILSVVVVIGLVVVGLANNIFQSPSAQVSSSAGKIGGLTSGGISIVDAVTDFDGDSLIELQNNSGEMLTLQKIVAGEKEDYFNEQLLQGNNKTFSISQTNFSCPCGAGQDRVSCSFDFYFLTVNGLEKVQNTTVNVVCVSNTVPVNVTSVVGLGDGTLDNPWVINSCVEFQNMESHLDGNYSLGGDINCYDTRNWNLGEGFLPIGNYDASPFTGSLNGRGHFVSDLYISRAAEDYVGVFRYSLGSISNIGLLRVDINGKNHVGGLAGWQASNPISNSYVTGGVNGTSFMVGGIAGYLGGGTISNSYFSGAVNGDGSDYYVGGIVGYSLGSVSDSYSSGSVASAAQTVGGLVGYLNGGSVSNSYSTSSVNGSVYVGGIVGYQVTGGSTISNSYSTGNVTGGDMTGGLVGIQKDGTVITDSYSLSSVSGGGMAGGFVGASEATISGSYSSGTVTGGGDQMGGFVGSQISGDISNCYSTSIVNSPSSTNVGGFAGSQGEENGTISNSYSMGSVTEGDNTGGFLGYHETGSISNSFWDKTTSGQLTSAGDAVGKTTAEMNTLSTFTNAGWDFGSVWNIDETVTYPYFR